MLTVAPGFTRDPAGWLPIAANARNNDRPLEDVVINIDNVREDDLTGSPLRTSR